MKSSHVHYLEKYVSDHLWSVDNIHIQIFNCVCPVSFDCSSRTTGKFSHLIKEMALFIPSRNENGAIKKS